MNWPLIAVRLPTLITAFVLTAGVSHAATCGSTVTGYRVAPGDSLSQIAQQMFGDTGSWSLIYEYPGNAEIIGRNPNMLGIGSTLQIPPCPGSVAQLPTEKVRQQAAPDAPATDLGTTMPETVYIVTGDDWAPYVDSNWSEGGMGTLLVKAAFEAVGLGDQIQIHHISDWNAQIHDLVPSNRYHLTFGWSMPDMTYWKSCSSLDAPMQIRCRYTASDPVFTISLGFFRDKSRLDLQDATAETISKMRICRPTGWSTFQMQENGIPVENLVEASSPRACFDKILDGTADFAVVNRPTGIAIATDMGISENIEMAPFTVPYRIHLLAYKDNPLNTATYIKEFNSGLKTIIDNGVYAQISSFFNDEFARRTQ